MIRILGKAVAAGALLIGMSGNALAGAMYSFDGTGTDSGRFNFAQATIVQTNSAIVIDQIGVWTNLGLGLLTQDHGVRIRDMTNNVDLFAGIITAGSGTLVDGFSYIDIPDVSVAAGVQLAIMSDNRSFPNTDVQLFELGNLAFDAQFTLIASTFLTDATVSDDPSGFDPFDLNVIAGANLLLAEKVPEPGTLALSLLGALGLARSRLAGRRS